MAGEWKNIHDESPRGDITISVLATTVDEDESDYWSSNYNVLFERNYQGIVYSYHLTMEDAIKNERPVFEQCYYYDLWLYEGEPSANIGSNRNKYLDAIHKCGVEDGNPKSYGLISHDCKDCALAIWWEEYQDGNASYEDAEKYMDEHKYALLKEVQS